MYKNLHPKPGVPGKVTRFIFGFIIGAIISISALNNSFYDIFYISLFIALSVSVICGILAIKKGDSFWDSIKDWIF